MKFSYADYMELQAEINSLNITIHAMNNELCFKCGRYRESHNGACDGCRWKKEDTANDK